MKAKSIKIKGKRVFANFGDDLEISGFIVKTHRELPYEFEPDSDLSDKAEKFWENNWEDIEEQIINKYDNIRLNNRLKNLKNNSSKGLGKPQKSPRKKKSGITKFLDKMEKVVFGK